MLLALLAFNLNTICRNELEDAVGGGWDMRRFVEFVLKVGGRMVKHSRRLVLRIAQSAEPLWSRLIERLEGWQVTLPQAECWPRLHASTGARPPARSASSVTAPIDTKSDFGEGAVVRPLTESTPKPQTATRTTELTNKNNPNHTLGE